MIDLMCFKITNTTYDDYVQFCTMMNLSKSYTSSKKIFFNYIINNKVIKDSRLDSIIVKGE